MDSGTFFPLWALFQAFLGTSCLFAAYACSRLAQRPYYGSFRRYTSIGVQAFSLLGLVWLAGAITNSLGTYLIQKDDDLKIVLAATTVGAALIWAAWQAWRWRNRRRA